MSFADEHIFDEEEYDAFLEAQQKEYDVKMKAVIDKARAANVFREAATVARHPRISAIQRAQELQDAQDLMESIQEAFDAAEKKYE